MLNIYCNKNINRPPEVRDRATAGLRSNRFKASIIKKWLCVVLCLLFLFSASWVAVPQAVHADSKDYLLDKVITWADGTTEHVQIDQDGFFRLDGVRRRLVGFEAGVYFRVPPDDTTAFWTPSNVAIFHTELDYLQSKGVRLISMELYYNGLNLESRLDDVLQLCYDHKMLVVPYISHKMNAICPLSVGEVFGSLATIDFSLGEETVSQQMPKWIDKVKSYSNVVSIILENEPEWQLDGQNYTVPLMESYISLIHGIAKARTSLPLLIRFWGLHSSVWELSMQNAIYPYSAIPCFNFYNNTATGFSGQCDLFRNWYISKGRSSQMQMWVTEMNYATGEEWPAGLHAELVTKAMIDGVLAHNVSVVFLFAMNIKNWTDGSFFDLDGLPIANTDTLMANMATWQAPIDIMLAQE